MAKKKDKKEEVKGKPHFIYGYIRKVKGSHERKVVMVEDLTPRGLIKDKGKHNEPIDSLEFKGHKGHGTASKLSGGNIGTVSRYLLSILTVPTKSQVFAGGLRFDASRHA